jgi:SAM-dependent methyltransferase
MWGLSQVGFGVIPARGMKIKAAVQMSGSETEKLMTKNKKKKKNVVFKNTLKAFRRARKHYTNFSIKIKSKIKNPGAFSPKLNLMDKAILFDEIRKFCAENNKTVKILDVGGGNGERKKMFPVGIDYWVLDIENNNTSKNFIQSDICDCNQVQSESFDIIFSMNLLEHVDEPWTAASEMVRMLKTDGLICVMAPFSWRYHPYPKDLFRFSAEGLEHLFKRTGRMDTILSGNDITKRRKNIIGGKIGKNLDVPPIDGFGGWRENWQSLYIGTKRSFQEK